MKKFRFGLAAEIRPLPPSNKYSAKPLPTKELIKKILTKPEGEGEKRLV